MHSVLKPLGVPQEHVQGSHLSPWSLGSMSRTASSVLGPQGICPGQPPQFLDLREYVLGSLLSSWALGNMSREVVSDSGPLGICRGKPSVGLKDAAWPLTTSVITGVLVPGLWITTHREARVAIHWITRCTSVLGPLVSSFSQGVPVLVPRLGIQTYHHHLFVALRGALTLQK